MAGLWESFPLLSHCRPLSSPSKPTPEAVTHSRHVPPPSQGLASLRLELLDLRFMFLVKALTQCGSGVHA